MNNFLAGDDLNFNNYPTENTANPNYTVYPVTEINQSSGNKNPPVCINCDHDCNKYWWLKTIGFGTVFLYLLKKVTGN